MICTAAPQKNRLYDIKEIHLENSWLVTVPVGDDWLHHFVCRCGHLHTLSAPIAVDAEPYYACQHCGNTVFTDAGVFEAGKPVRIWKSFHWSHTHTCIQEGWEHCVYYMQPLISRCGKKIRFRRREVFTHTALWGRGITAYLHIPHFKRYCFFDSHIMPVFERLIGKEAQKLLAEHLLQTPELKWLNHTIRGKSIDVQIETLSFFLKHQNLKDPVFMQWEGIEECPQIHRDTPVETLLALLGNHNGKQLRRILFYGYEVQLRKEGTYSVLADLLFVEVIQDKNYLALLLALPFTLKCHLFRNRDGFPAAQRLIGFLLSRYSEKQIVRYFTKHLRKTPGQLHWWYDTLRMINTTAILETLESSFYPVKLYPKELHNELVRVHHLYIAQLESKEEFSYTKEQAEVQREHRELVFQLPMTLDELHRWARTLHNCIYSYARDIHEGKTTVYGVFKENVLCYAIEIYRGDLIQASAAFNRHIPEEDHEQIREWFEITVHKKEWP
jgi:hypothetical protein